MKKIFLAAVICMFSSALFAQLSSPVNFGLHAGLVSTKADTDMGGFSGIKEKADNGMMLGAFLRINLNKWYVQPELNYVSRKSQLEILGDSYDIKTKSLDVPILLGYKIIKLPAFKLRAFAGPVASFKIDDSLKSSAEERLNGNFKGAVWNGKFGAGVDVWKLTLDVDYEVGFSDVAEDLKQNMVNVTLGFKIF
ncbi:MULTISPECIES: porin family protein [Labilibaculum]|uniref:Outer membrane beta-barrel protein n=1 Tax=Labilibaculum euxinus TaxID=2686357 RepID=A0A7M4D797_9BACT|nr:MULTISPECIES: porin family protein [Labilibaculum]MBN2598445.1 PorT family protein [Marinifilaceae bacterium]MUP38526.1 outer membrane beta-barrel protein [Labilibaculum euxinus]MVB07731.1 outer membrane beta-barrel protein [Labilibaculum euxinus]